MKKVKLLLVAALVTFSGVASAEMIQPLYNPTGDGGCGASEYYDYISAGYGYVVHQDIPALANGASYSTWGAYGNTVTVSCSGGMLYVYGDNGYGDLVAR